MSSTTFLRPPEPDMDLLFAIGQAIALAALLYGAALCFIWRDEYDPQTIRSNPPRKIDAPNSIGSQGKYMAAAETDPAS
jgi:hypothetical protein